MERLKVEISSSTAPEHLVHIAAVLSWETNDISVSEAIALAHNEKLSVEPWILEHKGSSNHRSEAVEKLISSNAPDWILFRAYLCKTWLSYLVPEAYEFLESAKALLDSNANLVYFLSEAYSYEALLERYQGNIDNVSKLLEMALKNARECDDILSEISLLLERSELLIGIDVREAMEGVQRAYNLSAELGVPYLETISIMNLGMLSSITGEYDLALLSWHKCVTYLQTQGDLNCHWPIEISRLYADINRGNDAVEWAKEAIAIDEGVIGVGGLDDHLCPHVTMAYALIVQGKLCAAQSYLDKSREIALRSGQEALLSEYYFVQGLHEVISGNTADGMDTLARSLEICDRTGSRPLLTNRCLLALARAEVERSDCEDINEYYRDEPGPWMIRLEQESRKRGLIGIQLQHALLKAEFQNKAGLHDVAIETLKAALGSYDSPGVETLRIQVENKIRDLTEC